MANQQEYETFFDTALIDTSTKKPIDREGLLELLKMHRVKTGLEENSEIPLKDLIPYLKKNKVKVPEAFYKDLASKLGLPFLDYSQIKKIYQKEEESN